MSWLKGLFSKEKKQKLQQLIKPDAHDFTAVLQAVGEEAIMATAYWLVKLVKQGLEPKTPSQVESSDPEANRTTAVEELLPKVVSLIEKSDQRSHAVTALESRIGAVEELVVDNHSTELAQSSQVMAALERRILSLEKLLEGDDVLTEKVGHNSQNMTALEVRVANIEKLLSTFSIVPKIVERQGRAIVALQNSLAVLKLSESQENSSAMRCLATSQPD